jgi:hypothetical protein
VGHVARMDGKISTCKLSFGGENRMNREYFEELGSGGSLYCNGSRNNRMGTCWLDSSASG